MRDAIKEMEMLFMYIYSKPAKEVCLHEVNDVPESYYLINSHPNIDSSLYSIRHT